MVNVEIDEGSGFCFGVTTAIKKAEEELAKGTTLYCLGDIVHNGQECERLKKMGLITINHEEFARLHNAKVLLRAHGEPPETYALAKANHIEIIDATCPVVLRLQKRIKQEFDNPRQPRHTNRDLREKRTRRSARTGGTDTRESDCHRKTGGSGAAGLQQRYPAVFTDHEIFGRVLADCGIYQGTHIARSLL